jgi:hypothetical protein
MSESAELEGGSVSAGGIEAIHSRKSVRVKSVSKSNESMRRPGNHASIANLVRDGIAARGFAGALRLQPSLGHRTRDNVPLNPLAFRAGKRSQILARAARLNRREFHWRTARRALRTLVLSVEHGLVPNSAL